MYRIKNISFTLYILVASANGIQRRADDDSTVTIRGPEASLVGRRRARRAHVTAPGGQS
jgi:hypothetical protein